jgi:hypothetical protein
VRLNGCPQYINPRPKSIVNSEEISAPDPCNLHAHP